MSTEIGSKINKLLASQPVGVVLLSSWLTGQGYSADLQKRYRKSHWLETIGPGAMIRRADKVEYPGAIYALQKEAGLSIHPAGKTALSLQGKAHYLELAVKKVTLFGDAKERLPAWLKKHDWGISIDYHSTSFLPMGMGMTELVRGAFSIQISSPARALMECLYLAPQKQNLTECYELMEGLNNIRPGLVQALLEQCKSVKVARLFLYMAEKAGHEWVKYLDLSKVNLGKGNRSIVKNGAYVSRYRITVPKEIENRGKNI